MSFTQPISAATASLLASIPSPPWEEISLGPLQFRLYGLMIAAGAIAAVSIARRRFAARGGDPEVITNLAIFAIPAGLVGARLYHVITDFSDKYSGGRWWPAAFEIWRGGLGIPGGVLLGAIVGVIVAKRMGVDWRQIADAAAPAIPVAQAIGRLGNYFNQELYGGPTKLPWGLHVDGRSGLFHPTFLYEGLWNLALAAGIVLAGRRIVLRPGRWFPVYIVGYGLGRLWVESLRIDFATQVWGLRVNTWISMVAIVGGLLWLFWGGNPVDRDATEELRAGGDPLAHAAGPGDAGDAAAPGSAGHGSGAAPADASSAEPSADAIGEARPRGDGPVGEGAVGEHDAAEGQVRVDPQERP